MNFLYFIFSYIFLKRALINFIVNINSFVQCFYLKKYVFLDQVVTGYVVNSLRRLQLFIRNFVV